MKALVPSAVLLLSSATLAETGTPVAVTEELVEYCKSKQCRTNVSFTLKKSDGSLYHRASALDVPVVDSGFLNLYPGEVVYAEAVVEANGNITLHHVAKIEKPATTLVFRFEQAAALGDGTGMLLTVSNPLSRAVKYRLGIMPLDGDTLLATSSCPLFPGARGSEHWPYPIFQVVAGDFHIIDVEKVGVVCAE